MNLAWYIVQVSSNMEDKVQESMANMISKKIIEAANIAKANQWRDMFGVSPTLNTYVKIVEFLKETAIMVPKEKIEEIKNGKKYYLERRIFPGYILLHTQYNDELGLLLSKTPKILGFVGMTKDSKPIPLSTQEAENIFEQIKQSHEKAKHRIEFNVGEKVRIIDGPFIDFYATIEEVLYNKSKVKVNVQIFGRDTPVELDFIHIEKNS